MRCPKCSEQNPEGATFCMSCATRLVLVCDQCGTELPPQARFCFNCAAPTGAPLSPVAKVASDSAAERLGRLVPREFAERLLATRGQVSRERRTVTILFSDIKGSTAMAENLDPEDVMEIMDGAFDVLIEPITRYEGTLARLMGDAVLAFFGAPIAHEDDAQRACLAALEIVEGAERYAVRLEKEWGIRGFNVRVGIHTGLVVVGEVGTDLRVEYTAMGDAVNLAARMESAAAPGTVLISEATYKLIAPLFETEALGQIQVKGKAEPVPVYRVLAAKPAPGKVRGIAGLESPLVGREAEFAALREAVERLQVSVGGVVTVVGEAGIGKSRLVAEVQSSAQGYGPVHLTWVEGRCLSYGTSIAYLLWLDILRGVLGVSVDDSPAAVRDALGQLVRTLCPDQGDAILPYLARMMSLPLEAGEEALLQDLDGGQLKARTFAAVEGLVEAVARDQPLALVCEDLHWADPTSMELLEHLLPLTDRVPLLFLCLLRPERGHASWRLRESAARDYPHRHTDLWLDPLSGSESEVLVGNLLPMEELPQQLKGRILRHAEGNPFYVEEVIRSLIDRGALVQEGASGRWEATGAVAEIAIPDTLHGVLLARIDRLQEEAKRVLQMAAVIGSVFLYRILQAIAAAEAAIEEQMLGQRLLDLQREEMIREQARVPELEYIFKHELTREAAYNGLLKAERRVYHRQVAEALEGLFPERVEEQVGLLAHHWERAGDAEKATEYLLRAGDQARLASAHQEAIGYYQRALVFLKEREENERAARTLMKLGLTYHNTFEFEAARQAYEEGFAQWQRVEEAEPASPPWSPPHALRVAIRPPVGLDPGLESDGLSFTVIEQLFSGLVELTPEMSVVPDVARRWEVLEGGRKYVFHLRDDVVWSDGVPVTAGDFEYAWKRMLDPAIGFGNRELLYDIRGARAYNQREVAAADRVGVRALDELTLLVELEGPTGYFLQLLRWLLPVPRHVVEAHGGTWTEVDSIVNNGPFRLAAWERGESMVLERYPSYHGRFSGNLERVELCFHSGPADDVLEQYEEHRLDTFSMLFLLSPRLWHRARERYAGDYRGGPVLRVTYVGFDASRPPFDDRRVRRAFTLALDREALAHIVTGGYTDPASGGLVPPGMPGHSPGIALPFDPERARRLLVEAGLSGHGFPALEGLAVDVPVAASTVEYYRRQWQENLGIEVSWKTMAWDKLVDRLSRKTPHVWLMSWTADYPDPDSILRVADWKTQAGWQSEDFDQLVESARRVLDQQERMRLYRQADKIVVEEAPILPVAYGCFHRLVKPWVLRYPTSPTGSYFWKDVLIEPH
jgi:ABC-type oligopeptide transport system substrate-binding subunit/class 3 adenylate cyclase